MLVMTLLVRDEVDIVRDNLLFHLNGPVDHVIATDNGSTDGTREILEEFRSSGTLTLFDEPGDDYSQSAWVTRMTDFAQEKFKSAWVLNNDADEFWMLDKADIAAFDDLGWGVVRAQRRNMFAASYSTASRAWVSICRFRYRDPAPVPRIDDIYDPGSLGAPYLSFELLPKVMAKVGTFSAVAQGNHSVDLAPGVASGDASFAIYHFPVRSARQFRRKVEAGGRAYARNETLSERTGWHWRRWYRLLQESGRIDSALSDAVPDVEAIGRGLGTGEILLDQSFLSAFEARVNRSGAQCSANSRSVE